ncbi:MAG: hypothetical protein KTR15_15920, partial [Phycisphaeraceae bacterium]|nr:hypothetical protein [Phycisphaeraceae bacterium]
PADSWAHQMLLEELYKLADAGELISVERDCHDVELTGLLSHVSDSLIAMHLFTNEGDFDGIAIFKFDQIEEVYWGNREHKAIQLLIDQSVELPHIEVAHDDFFSAIVELNAKYPSICVHSAHAESRYDIAHIEDYDHDWCKILTFSPMKSLSRTYKLIQSQSISRIVVESPYQNGIVRLHSQGL